MNKASGPSRGEWITAQTDCLPRQSLSYWLAMARDFELDYRWSTDGKPLYAEMRGERADARTGKYKTFDKTSKNEAGGFFVAPFAGKFGWYWRNSHQQPLTLRRIARGTTEYRASRTRQMIKNNQDRLSFRAIDFFLSWYFCVGYIKVRSSRPMDAIKRSHS